MLSTTIMKKTVHVVGFNVLLKKIDSEGKSSAGIILPDNAKENLLHCGLVIQKGPGFLMPDMTESKDEIRSIIEGSTEPKATFIPLDIEEGDTAFYPKDAGNEILLEGNQYVIVPYPAIKLFIRNRKEDI